MRRRPLLTALPFVPGLMAGAARAQGELVDVQKRAFSTRRFRLESGVVIPEITIAYETYGTLAPDGRNAVLLTHGYTSSQHMAGRYSALKAWLQADSPAAAGQAAHCGSNRG